MTTETAPVVRRSERLGVLIPVQSKSRPDHTYWMAWAPVSGWVHADSSCPAFKDCWHKPEAEKIMTSLVVRQDQEGIVERPVLLVEYDAQAISAGVDPEVAAKWAYNLPGGGGKGVGVRGVEEGVRLLSSHGEVIRVDQVVMVHHDDREAFFSATASRYVISPDGVEVKLDSQTRGKRVPKIEQHSESYMREHPNASLEYLNPNWYELGIVKASRNAALALMPSNVKTALLRAGLDAAGGGGGTQQRQTPPRRSGTAQQQPNSAPNGASAMTAFWADAKRLKLDSDTVLAKSQQMFDNREPIALTAQERIDLLTKLTQEKQGSNVVDPAHAAVMVYDEEGHALCEVCGKPVDEQNGEHSPVAASLPI